MARQANIVSFDDVKSASLRRRAQQQPRAERYEDVPVRPRYVYYDLNRFADTTPSRFLGEDFGDGGSEQADRPARRQSKKSANRAKLFSLPTRQLRTTRSQRASRNRRIEDDYAEYADYADYSEYAEYADYADYTDYDDYTERGHTQAASSRRERRQKNQKKRAKDRAGKLFERTYGGSDAVSADFDEAPRAALYEGQMGSSQRRAARMQRASEAGSAMAKIDPAGWFSNLSIKPRTMKLATAVLCLVLAVVFLYTPAQHYYQSTRERDRLAAEYAIVEERNATLASQNQSLASNAGMEDAARQKYGYVKAGEETAVVTGLSEATIEEHRAASTADSNVLSSSVKAEEEWYTPYLDALFGVS